MKRIIIKNQYDGILLDITEKDIIINKSIEKEESENEIILEIEQLQICECPSEKMNLTTLDAYTLLLKDFYRSFYSKCISYRTEDEIKQNFLELYRIYINVYERETGGKIKDLLFDDEKYVNKFNFIGVMKW